MSLSRNTVDGELAWIARLGRNAIISVSQERDFCWRPVEMYPGVKGTVLPIGSSYVLSPEQPLVEGHVGDWSGASM